MKATELSCYIFCHAFDRNPGNHYSLSLSTLFVVRAYVKDIYLDLPGGYFLKDIIRKYVPFKIGVKNNRFWNTWKKITYLQPAHIFVMKEVVKLTPHSVSEYHSYIKLHRGALVFSFFFCWISRGWSSKRTTQWSSTRANWESVRKNVTKSLPLRSCYVINAWTEVLSNACGADAAREEPVATSQSRLGLQPSPLAEGSKESVAIFWRTSRSSTGAARRGRSQEKRGWGCSLGLWIGGTAKVQKQ